MNLPLYHIQEFERLALSPAPEALSTLRDHLLDTSLDTMEKHFVPNLACRALLSKGTAGLDVILECLESSDGHIRPAIILNALFRSSMGEHAPAPYVTPPQDSVLQAPISIEIQKLAREKFLDFIDECKVNPDAFDRLINLLSREQTFSYMDEVQNKRFHAAIFTVLTDSTLKITDKLIDQFEQMIDSELREEEYQRFLSSNPIFLDPLAKELIDKHRLGDDLITDYVLEKLTGEYIVIEIEKPSDQIFTQSNDFSHKLTHAFGQVLDFIEWTEQNISYAQKKLPGVSSPKGILVIGKRKNLTPTQIDKLRRFNRNSNSIEVKTFDDLVEGARTLKRNIRQNFQLSFTKPAQK